ncbi:MAG: TIGR00268 family protein, partial [Cyanobacteriota bacterium]|nr:TIGR00268 family protein [Cyanobacteriota bacterium]
MFRQLEPLPDREYAQLQRLRKCLASFRRVCVAYSGGVDSALVA